MSVYGRLSRRLSLQKLGLYCSGTVFYAAFDLSSKFVFSVVHKTSTTSTRVKMPFQSSLESALKVVVQSLHVSFNVLTTMKLP